jgi:hypothetical protein
MGRVNRLCRLAIPAAVSLAAIGAIATQARSAPVPAAPAVTSYTVHGFLHDVAATSASNAWAAGHSGGFQGAEKTLLLHWNGSRWSQVLRPAPVYGEFDSVTAVSADDAWAVGETTTSAGTDGKPLVRHWNGKVWSRQAQGVVNTGWLMSVAVSRDGVWAVGSTDYQPCLIVRETGSRWYVVPSQTPANSVLFTVAAVPSRGTVWAAGVYNQVDGLLAEWNGTVWKPVTTPLQGAYNFLDGIAASPAGQVWVVGAHYDQASTAWFPASMLWNGRTWLNRAVGPFASGGLLQNVAFVPGGTAWAVGEDASHDITLRWTGHAWSRVANPYDHSTGPHSDLLNVAAVSPSDAWAVGYVLHGSLPYTVILHWNGKTWS